jgi:uncharacterized protein (DUF1330 family)
MKGFHQCFGIGSIPMGRGLGCRFDAAEKKGRMRMAKGYWIARVDVRNMDGYREYVAQNGAVFKKYGARFLVRGGTHEAREGTSRSRNVVLEFKDYETALACYNSPEYARLVAIRSPHSEGDLVIIEGYDGPQP